MATLALRAVGTVIGGIFGPVGAAIGSAIGSVAGYAIDQSLLNGTRRIEGARLNASQAMIADEGHPIPSIYGHTKLSGTLIWGTRLLETKKTERSGSKGGGPSTETTTYSYSASFAVAAAIGPISMIKRIWADGKEVDQNDHNIRIYLGDEDQLPDPLIAIKQGQAKTPAYRGIAYIVFEDFPLDRFGNRIPQIQIETVHAFARLETSIKAMCLIPGATEYGYATRKVCYKAGRGEAEWLNRHVSYAHTDFEASLDELLATCPNLEAVSLVVPWFGDDLRVDRCRLRPGVTHKESPDSQPAWRVGSMFRLDSGVRLISSQNDQANYGGTPADWSVIEAIRELKSRGLRVVVNPFVMMDIEAGNGLPDPWGYAEQQPHPWRGRIACHPASVDQSEAAAIAISLFVGSLQSSDFQISGDQVQCNHPDFTYRHMILHMAHLAALAGGVDGFLIGSEMVSLTRLRDENSNFPFVNALCDLASEVRTVLGSETTITYGADWTEYASYQPSDGSGDVFYNMDRLWAHSDIDVIAIDNYLPLSDWRDDDARLTGPNPDGARHDTDYQALRKALTSGEGYDWYYANLNDRIVRQRSPITDGAHEKPWVYRIKDIANWWSTPHVERRAGVEIGVSTTYVPKSKPIWFSELGCPAVDKGANQPNVFPDPKSSESRFPHFSSGARDDMVQRCYLEAVLDAIDEDSTFNPTMGDGSTRMLDRSNSFLWAWDMRPYPTFPLQTATWADGANWLTGHWLNGRLGTAPASELCATIARNHGVPIVVQPGIGPVAQGASFVGDNTARERIEAIADISGLKLTDTGVNESSLIHIDANGRSDVYTVNESDLVTKDQHPILRQTQKQASELPRQVTISHVDVLNDYRIVATATPGAKQPSPAIVIDSVLNIDENTAFSLANSMLARARSPQTLDLALPISHHDLEAGDIITLSGDPEQTRWRVIRHETSDYIRIHAERFDHVSNTALISAMPPTTRPIDATYGGNPDVIFIDLPAQSGVPNKEQFRVAVVGRSGRSQSLFASPTETNWSFRGFARAAATTGVLATEFAPGVASGRFLWSDRCDIKLDNGELESVEQPDLLTGRNLAAVRSSGGAWEVFQFAAADEIAPSYWRLSGMLRGQGGTEDQMRFGASAGADFVLLDRDVVPAGLSDDELGRQLYWRVGPSGKQINDENFSSFSETGGQRSLKPLSPVHLRAVWSSDGLTLGWIRRARTGGDSWDGLDISLGEELERYRVRLRDDSGVFLEAEVSEPSIFCANDTIAQADGSLSVEIAQLSMRVGAGFALTAPLEIQ